MYELKKDSKEHKDCHVTATSISASDRISCEIVSSETAKDYINELLERKELLAASYDDVQAVICRYKWFEKVRHGQNILIDGQLISWHFNNDIFSGTPSICFYDGHEWQDDLYLDEIPCSILIYILKQISKHPLRHDEQPYEVLRALKDASQPKIWLSCLPQKYHTKAEGNGSRPA